MAAKKTTVSDLMMIALGGEDPYELVMESASRFYAAEFHRAEGLPYEWVVGWDLDTGFRHWKKVHVEEDPTSILIEKCRVLLEKSREANYENRRALHMQEMTKLRAEGTPESIRKAFWIGLDQFDEDSKRIQWLKDRKSFKVYGW
jgi:hypothetical protein